MTAPIPPVIATIDTSIAVIASPPERDHLLFLDGLRGLAALYIVFYHATGAYNWRTPSDPPPLWTLPFRYSGFAVAIFIVLSGFVLMLPVVKYNGLRNGVKEFFFRRAKRILPPYYVALIVSIPISSLALHTYFTKGNVLMHFLLLHNMKTEWNMTINGVMWSVATEWQIYFVFALILVPIWRKFGLTASVISAFAIGLIPHYLLPVSHNLDWAHPWFLGLFALGMVAAVAYRRRTNYFPNPYTVLLFTAVCIVSVCFWSAQSGMQTSQWTWLIETLIGVATAVSILACCQPNAVKPIVNFLQHPALLKLGAFSYSLYLFHQPILSLFAQILRRLPISFNTFMILMVTVSIPVSMAISYLFYLLVEKQFTTHPKSFSTS